MIILLKKKNNKRKILNFQTVTYFFTRGTVNKKEFTYVEIVLVVETNMCNTNIYKKLLVLIHLILSKD